MSDIFISYATGDKSKVKPIAKTLEKLGWSIFWERNIPGGKIWDEVIEEELDTAKCLIVVWSNNSKISNWVRAEEEEGSKRDILVSVLIEDIKFPLSFRPDQAISPLNWQEDSNHPQFKKLLQDLTSMISPSSLTAEEKEQE